MQKKAFLSVLIIAIMTGIAPRVLADEWPRLAGPYLGQKPPGMTPEMTSSIAL